ncbi:malate dehydrogenase (quinone) [Aureimonas populi]|uniref:Probable malate:quinone oxidoreductase n=1 Tax=Aureimonas populi TaxID=1701758 RepID=A0ABW5CGU9_9HYPH|nr:malate dehydrogenase (quinone) [Aureimonas populi]
MSGALAGAAVTALPGCAAPSATADREVDVVLIGGGIMSATLGVLLRHLEPGWTMEMFERREGVAMESSNAWHNAGTGHAALCELNYTPEDANGNISIDRALATNEAFQISRQFWASMVREGVLENPGSFINTTPHMSFVWGEEDVDFLRRRHEALRGQPLFSGMEYSADPERIREWAPHLIAGRLDAEPVAATWSSLGTDVDFGQITRQFIGYLDAEESFALHVSTEVENIERNDDGTWRVTYRNLEDGSGSRAVNARFVFVGGGGGALSLLQKSGIPEIDGYAGFPVGGSFLVNETPEVADTHFAKAYGKAAVGAPPMSVPHLDTRVIDGKRMVLFGPFATFSTNFLMDGSRFDLFSSITTSNILPMLQVGWDELGLVRYLVGEVLQSQEDRVEALRHYYPQADGAQWRLVQAGQRVQIIKHGADGGADLVMGTEIVSSQDGSIAGLLGASPGASTAPSIMLGALGRLFPEQFATARWQERIHEMVPGFGMKLNDEPQQLAEIWAYTSEQLGLTPPPPVVGLPA